MLNLIIVLFYEKYETQGTGQIQSSPMLNGELKRHKKKYTCLAELTSFM